MMGRFYCIDPNPSDLRMKDRWIDVPFSPRRWPVFYGWVILLFGVIGTLMSLPGQTIGVSPFKETLQRELFLSSQSISTAYMVGTFASGMILTFAGRLYDRWGARVVGPAAGALLGVVLVGLSQVDRVSRTIAALAGLEVGAPMVLDAVSFEAFRPDPATVPTGAFLISFVTVTAGFLALRFFGQGVLTLVSRNVPMKWFVHYRGRINSALGLFVSVGFSLSPLVFSRMIDSGGWRWAWLALAGVVGVAYPLVGWLFLRDNPEQCGLHPDGRLPHDERTSVRHEPEKQFTLREAQRTYALWVYAVGLSLFSLYITAFMFHVESIFRTAGWANPEEGFAIFAKTVFISVPANVVSSFISDFIRLKYLLIVMLSGLLLSSMGILILSPDNYALYLVVLGNGITSGTWGVLSAVTWPRYYGREHLGEISGFFMKWVVCMSAVGPLVFAWSFTKTGTYDTAALGMIGIVTVLMVLAVRARNPNRSDETVRG